jgi:hypothetical protein
MSSLCAYGVSPLLAPLFFKSSQRFTHFLMSEVCASSTRAPHFCYLSGMLELAYPKFLAKPRILGREILENAKKKN